MRWWLGSFAAAVAFPLLILLSWLFVAQVRREETDARDTALRIARAVGAQLQSAHRDSVVFLEQMSKRPAVRDYDGRTCDPLFAIINFLPQYATLFYFDPHGKVLCAAEPDPPDREASDAVEKWITADLADGKLEARAPIIRNVNGRLISVLMTPVNGSDGRARGYLALVELPDISVSALPPSAVLTIIDSAGNVLARSTDPNRWTGRNVRGSQITETVLRHREGRVESTGLDGVSRQYGFTFVPEIGWHVYVGIPTAVLMQDVRSLFIRGLAGGVIVVAIVIVVALLLSRSIVRPIAAVVHSANVAAAGEFEKVEITRAPNEIATLAEAFNRMTDNRREAEHRMKALSERLLAVQEAERMRIARTVHDDLGQSITALKMDVLGLAALTPDVPGVAAMRSRIESTLDATVRAVQQIATDLRPSMLDDLGLVAALQSEARVFEDRTGIECDLSVPQEPMHIDPASSIALYRIVQEALTNVSRHSDATRVELRLRERSGELLLEVRDDGRGITEAEIDSSASIGLMGIRERAAIVGGSVHFEGIGGGGTIVSVRIPSTAREDT